MIGFCLTGDLFNLFVFFELMSVAAIVLVGYEARQRAPVEGSLAFAVTSTVGAILLLWGVALLYGRTGALNLAQIGCTLAAQPSSATVLVAFALVAAGLLVKAAAVPFHLWTADAYTVAPTPVCILLAGAFAELGLFGLARVWWTAFEPALGAHAGALRAILVGAGVLTVLGAVMCAGQHHLKRMLAFATIAQVGLSLVALGLLSADGLAGAADGTLLARVERRGRRWIGERVGSPLSGGYVPSSGGAAAQRANAAAHSSSSAWTNAWGRLPRSWRWVDVELLGEQARAGRRPRGFARTSARRDAVAALVVARARARSRTAGTRLRPARADAVGAVAVAVAVLGELVRDGVRASRWRGGRRRDRAADRGRAAARRRRAHRPASAASGPERGRRVAAVSATIASASASQRRSRARGSHCAIARSPAAQISRLCVQASGSSSQTPASGLAPALLDRVGRDLGGAPRVRARGDRARAAAANSSSASPKASSWNCSLTQLPTTSLPPGTRAGRGARSSGTRCGVDRVGGRQPGPVGRAAARRRTPRRRRAGGAARRRRPPARRSTGRGSRRSGSRSCGPGGRARAATSSRRRPCRRCRAGQPGAARRRRGVRRAARTVSLERGNPLVAMRPACRAQARSGVGRRRPSARRR